MAGLSVTLRRINIDDAPVIADLINDIEVVRNLRDFIPFPYTIEDAKQYVAVANENDGKYIRGIEYEGQLCGVIGFVPMTDVYRFTVDLGYWLGKKYWNRGIMTIAVRQFVNHIFDIHPTKRIQAGVFSFNLGSQKVLEKAGFVKETVNTNHVYKLGGFHDEYMYVKFNESI